MQCLSCSVTSRPKEGSKCSAFQGLNPSQHKPSESLVVSSLALCHYFEAFYIEILLLLFPQSPVAKGPPKTLQIQSVLHGKLTPVPTCCRHGNPAGTFTG